MKTREEVQRHIDKIMSDERVHYPAANVVVNAPLALVQLELKVEVRTLCWAYDLPLPKFHGGKK